MSSSPLIRPMLVLIRGAGDLASGVAVRLHRCGFNVIMTELAQPLAVRRSVAFAQAVYAGVLVVEEVVARCVPPRHARAVVASGEIPVLVDPTGTSIASFQPDVLVDGRMAKQNLGTTLNDATLVIGLGPGFTAGLDCHAVIETNRGHNLGRVIWQGQSEPNTGVPGALGGEDALRVLRVPVAGVVEPLCQIGDSVRSGDVVARVGQVEVRTAIGGVVRGILHPGLAVPAGTKLGDIDPRADVGHVRTVSDKSLAVAGGVLEAILASSQ